MSRGDRELLGLCEPLPNAARRLLYVRGMAQSLRNRDDFTLRIVVAEPEKWHPALVDEEGATRPFKKPMLDTPPARLRPKPEPLSTDDHGRMAKRARAQRRIAWAQRLLRIFNF
jgi:hypothetical protein